MHIFYVLRCFTALPRPPYVCKHWSVSVPLEDKSSKEKNKKLRCAMWVTSFWKKKLIHDEEKYCHDTDSESWDRFMALMI